MTVQYLLDGSMRSTRFSVVHLGLGSSLASPHLDVWQPQTQILAPSDTMVIM